jgi:hypothetical protein
MSFYQKCKFGHLQRVSIHVLHVSSMWCNIYIIFETTSKYTVFMKSLPFTWSRNLQLFWKPEVQYSYHKNLSLNHILNYLNPVHTLCFVSLPLALILPALNVLLSTPRSPTIFSRRGFSSHFHAFLSRAGNIHRDHQSRGSLLYSFLQPAVCTAFGSFFCTLFWKILYLFFA